MVDTPGIGLVTMLVTGDQRQRLGDMAGHTSVVDAKASSHAADAFDLAQMQAQPADARAEAKAKRSRRSWVGRAEAAVVRPFEGAEGAKAKQPKPAKKGRPSLGGPELKLPSLRRSKAPKAPKAPKVAEAPEAAEAQKQPKPAKKGRPSLGGPELKLPSLGRSKAPKAPKAARSSRSLQEGPPEPGWSRAEAALLRPQEARARDVRAAPVQPEPVAPARSRAATPKPPVAPTAPATPPAPAPPAAASAGARSPDAARGPRQRRRPQCRSRRRPEAPAAQEPPAPPPVPEVKPFDPFADDAPEPSVEVVAHDVPEPPPAAPEPPAPEILGARRARGRVEIVRDDVGGRAGGRATGAAPTASVEPEHVEGIRDDGSSRVNVKPIETVSAMELLMQRGRGAGPPRAGSLGHGARR